MKYWTALLFILGCELAGSIGSIFTFSAIPNWYAYLNKPFFSPPNWIFGPVWTTLYAMMGVALYLVCFKKSKYKQRALVCFGIQLGLNALWSIIFFGWRNPLIAGLEVILMWTFIAMTIFYFAKINRTAAWLLVPYLAWVSFATILNWSIVFLN